MTNEITRHRAEWSALTIATDAARRDADAAIARLHNVEKLRMAAFDRLSAAWSMPTDGDYERIEWPT